MTGADTDLFVVGGGPSLADFDWTRLWGREWIGANLAYLHGPDWSVAKDLRWMETYACRPSYRAIPTRRLYVGDRFDCPPWVERVRNRMDWSASLEDGLCAQADTGLTCLNLADVVAAGRRIVLLGFDFSSPNGREANWHDAYPWHRRHDRVYLRYLDWWEKFVPDLRHEVVNATVGGRLDLFPRVDVDEVLEKKCWAW